MMAAIKARASLSKGREVNPLGELLDFALSRVYYDPNLVIE